MSYELHAEKRTELPRPWGIEPGWFWEQVESKLGAIGYRLRRKDFIWDLDFIYNNSADTIRALNQFLDCWEEDLDGMLDAVSALNTLLNDTVDHIRASRGFRERVASHLGWKLELAEARPPTEAERRIVSRLLHGGFPGRDQIRDQVQKFLVTTGDENGSLLLYPDKPKKVRVSSSVPVWGEARDEDGVTIYVRLHVIEGWLKELEITREDGSPVMRPPEPGSLIVRHV